MWLVRSTAFLLVVCVLSTPAQAAVCPDRCVCSTTRDGLHRATCSDLALLYKFTLRQKHHNINILDLSHNNITKLSHELDRLTEVVTLDLSTNGIQNLNKFLHNAKKLVHLNLANNRITKLSLTYLPISVSSLDLTDNLLQDVPSELAHLQSLEHLQLEGNPLTCSCENIMARDQLLQSKVLIDHVKCAAPAKFNGQSWLELKTKDVCKTPKTEINFLDMMMGDQPIDAVQVGQETTALKSMPMVANSDLDDGKVIQAEGLGEEDDSLLYMKVKHATPSAPFGDFGSGSGDYESSTISDFLIEPRMVSNLNSEANDEFIPIENDSTTTEEPFEGSGEGSGFGLFNYRSFEDSSQTSTPAPLPTDPVHKLFEDDDKSSTEFPIPSPPTVYQGGINWNSDPEPSSSTETVITSPVPRDTTVSEKMHITQAPAVLEQLPADKESQTTHKTGTYVCIAIIVMLLVGLIGFAIIKGQMRKRRDRRLLRQQKRDVEKASKEMVDMNKSLLGKPAPLEAAAEKKINGKYELVPTHEPAQKKGENGDLANGANGYRDTNGVQQRTDSPRDTNQNKSSSRDNNLSGDSVLPQQETSFDSAPASPDSRKDSHSLSSEDIFVPIHDDDIIPRLNGTADSDISQPLMNGDQTTDSDFLSPSREYVPVYSPDMGRVRIKMTEMPKPKTPVLVTRSRSNAGDIIITPSDVNVRKSTT